MLASRCARTDNASLVPVEDTLAVKEEEEEESVHLFGILYEKVVSECE